MPRQPLRRRTQPSLSTGLAWHAEAHQGKQALWQSGTHGPSCQRGARSAAPSPLGVISLPEVTTSWSIWVGQAACSGKHPLTQAGPQSRLERQPTAHGQILPPCPPPSPPMQKPTQKVQREKRCWDGGRAGSGHAPSAPSPLRPSARPLPSDGGGPQRCQSPPPSASQWTPCSAHTARGRAIGHGPAGSPWAQRAVQLGGPMGPEISQRAIQLGAG